MHLNDDKGRQRGTVMRITSTCRAERKSTGNGAMNRGLGSRDPYKAAENAGKEMYNKQEIGGVTQNGKVSQFHQFLDFHKDNYNYINNLNKIDNSHLERYAEHLLERISNEEITAGTASNYISSINTMMNQINGNNEIQFKSPSEYGIPNRTGIAQEDREVDPDTFHETKQELSPHHSAMFDLQHDLGLRFEESAKFDATDALKKIGQGANSIKVKDGTKSGRPRTVPLTKEAKASIKNAAQIQSKDRSMIPSDKTYKQFRNECYDKIRGGGCSHHDNRHTYAHNEYRRSYEEKGYKVEPPVRAGISPPAAGDKSDRYRYSSERLDYLERVTGLERSEAKALDKEIRLELAEKLGHSRVSITNNYLG